MVAFVSFLVIVLFATIALGGTAKQFFAKASSCPMTSVSSAQVSANSAVIGWQTNDATQGRVEYGTNATNLSFTAPEASAGKSHNVPLTLLTPNTVYYYVVAIADTRCDSSGQKCEAGSCVPFSFTTAAVNPQTQIVAPLLSPTPAVTGAPKVASSSATALSAFCQQVKAHIGESVRDTSKWAASAQYDIDGNGIINGMDVVRCQKAGK